MNEEFDYEEIPDFPEVVKIAKSMFTNVLHSCSPQVAAIVVEQMRASIREHPLEIGCDPNDEMQIRAFTMGSLFAIHRQIQYTQIGHEAAIVPATAINMIKDPVEEGELVGLDILRNMMEEEELRVLENLAPIENKEKRESALLAFARHIFEFGQVRKNS